MSNIIGATVRINTGKVEYVVAEQNEDGTYNLKGEKSSRKNIPAEKLIVTREADVEHATVEDLEAKLNRTQIIADSTPAKVTVPEFYNRPEDTFDARSDRRQSAYGLNVLAQVFRKNPAVGRVGTNPLKPIGSKRAKVRKRIKATRTRLNNLSREYNTTVRENAA